MERLNDQSRQLAAQYYYFAIGQAKKFFKIHPYVDWWELKAAAHMALMTAAQNFNPSRNIKFVTLAYHHIYWRFRDVLNQYYHKRDKEQLLDFNSLQTLEDSGDVIEGFIEDFNTNINHYENTEEVEWLLKKLPKQYASVMRDIYVLGLSRQTAGKNHKLSRTRIASIVQESKKIITEELNYYGKFTDAKERN